MLNLLFTIKSLCTSERIRLRIRKIRLPTYSLKAANATAIPLILRMSIGGNDHLLSDEQPVYLPHLLLKKQTINDSFQEIGDFMT